MPRPVIPYCGRAGFADLAVGSLRAGANSSRVSIFGNDFWPTDSSTLANFVGLTATGLTSQPLPATTTFGFNAGGRAIWQFATINFTAAGSGLPAVGYGYWVDCIDPITSTRVLLWYQRWDQPFAWLAPGNNYPLNLSLGGTQC